MRQVLQVHPDFICEAVSGVEVEVERPSPGQLLLRYRVSGITDARDGVCRTRVTRRRAGATPRERAVLTNTRSR